MLNGCEHVTGTHLAVVPVLIGPLQTLLALLPAILSALAGLLLAMFRPRVLRTFLILLWRQRLAAALLVCAVVSAVYALPRVHRSHAGGNTPQAFAPDWPMFRGGPQRRGTAEQGPDPTTGGALWAFTGDKTFHSSPVLVGNCLYAVSADKGVFADAGAIYCLDAGTGEIVWRSAPGEYRASFSSPAVCGRYLVCGEGLHQTRDARILCLDAGDGRALWEFRTSSHVESSPCISGDRVFVGAGDDGYYCFALSGNGHGGPKLLWHAPPEKFPDAESSPLVIDGRVYVGLGESGQAVCCLDAASGEEIWRTPTPCPVFAAPTMADGKILIGMGIGNYIEDEQQVRQKRLDKLREQGAAPEQLAEAQKSLPLGGAVWCLDAASGKLLWSFDTPATVLGAIAAKEDHMCFASRDGRVFLLSPEGKELAHWDAHAPILASPAITGRHAYVTTGSGRVHCLSLPELGPVWEALIGGTGQCLSSPTIARGHVYTGSAGAGLLCLGQAGVEKRDDIWAGALAGPGRNGCLAPQAIAESGQYLWSFDAGKPTSGPASPPSSGDQGDPPRTRISGPAACVSDRLYVPVLEGLRNGLVCLRHDPKSVQGPSELWFLETALGVPGSPAVAGGTVFFVEGARGQQGRTLHCVDGRSGKRLWQAPVDPQSSGQLLLAGGRVILQETEASLACLSYDGGVCWRQNAGALAGSPAVVDDMLITVSDCTLAAWDLPTGKGLWSVAIGPLRSGPVPVGDRVCVAQADGIGAYSLRDGKNLWTSAAGRAAGPITTDGRRLAYVSDKGQAVVLNLAGEVLETIDQASDVAAPLFCGDQLVYASSAGILTFDLSTPGSPRRWLRTARYGDICSPLIAADSRVYFATEKNGLICAGEQVSHD
jgi:outer membrane protein assembly factor BamB